MTNEEKALIRLNLLTMKGDIQGQYIASIETNNFSRTAFLRGELSIIDRMLKEFEKQ